MSLGERIKVARKAAGLTQAALAALCGWDPPSRLANYEQGIREPSLADLRLIADQVASGGHTYGWIVLGEDVAAQSQLQRPDPAILRRTHRFLEKAFKNEGGYSLDDLEDADLFADAYEWLSEKVSVADKSPDNLVSFEDWVKRKQGKHGHERSAPAGKAATQNRGQTRRSAKA